MLVVAMGFFALLLAGSSAFAAAEFTFTVQNHDPATSIGGQYLEAWCGKIKEVSGGRIDFVYYHGGSLVGAADAVDAVENGTADIIWTALNLFAGKFSVAESILVPMNGINGARMGAKVIMDMLAEIPEMQAQFAAYKVIQLSTCSYMPLSMTSKKVEKADDLKGLRMRVAGTPVIYWAKGVGISPMTIPTPETYESLQRGVIDGCANDWHNIAALKLTEVTKYIMDVPIGVSPLAVLMNKDSYNGLPDDLKAIIDKYSGAYASDMAGVYWDSTRAWVLDNPGKVEIYSPSEQFVKDISAGNDAVRTEFINYLNGKGLEGERIYKKFQEIIERHKGKFDFSKPVNISDFKG
jgi:TRAP-type C4-dicarboxylate transport system substrate-binding protein